jgi:hypothetical protein
MTIIAAPISHMDRQPASKQTNKQASKRERKAKNRKNKINQIQKKKN